MFFGLRFGLFINWFLLFCDDLKKKQSQLPGAADEIVGALPRRVFGRQTLFMLLSPSQGFIEEEECKFLHVNISVSGKTDTYVSRILEVWRCRISRFDIQ